jgi:nucleotide-binding universal stress UspA family protein
LYPAPIEPPDINAVLEEEEANGKRILAEARRVFEHAGLGIESIMQRGDAATEILDFARRHPVDLIACGSRGLSEVTGWLLGSLSRKLVHYAPCSVLIVK